MFPCMVAMAVPAKPGMWRNIKLAGGTEVKAELCGDEFTSWYRAADGRCFEKISGANLFEERNMLQISAKATMQKKRAQNVAVPQPLAKKSLNKASYFGSKKCLVILAEFPDCPFSFDLDQHQKLVNQVNYNDPELGFIGSVRDWFRAQSYNQFDIDFDVVGPFTMGQNYAYYGAHSAEGNNDSHVATMIGEAVVAADPYVNYQDYDWDGDGEAELVFVIYAGRGEASGGNDDTIWPHKWDLYSAYYYGDGPSYQYLDGTYVNTYACSCELQNGGVNREDLNEGATPQINGIGTICHEFSHCLGLPDYYDVEYTGFQGMGYWDVMCSGSYLGNSFIPCGYTAYERQYCGWLNITELTENTTVSALHPIVNNPEAYAIYNDANRNEFFVIENRQKTGWDAALYGQGMLVYHVDYDADMWYANAVNTNSRGNDHERCTFIPADGVKTYYYASDIAGDVYPYGTNNSLSYNTNPALDIYTPFQGQYVLPKGIYNITRNGSNISFDFMNHIEDPTAVSFSADAIELAQGQTAQFAIQMEAEGVSAVQFNLTLPQGLSLVEEAGTPVYTLSRTTSNQHQASFHQDAQGIWHVVVVSSSNQVFSGKEGKIITLQVKAAADAPVGSSNLSVTNIVTSTANSLSKQPDNVLTNATVVAATKYQITFVNYDGAVLQSSEVAYGETPVYTGTTPTKAATAEYSYIFAGWSPEVVAATANATYTATYTDAANIYQLVYKVDGEVYAQEAVAYGSAIVLIDEPTKEGYIFSGWSGYPADLLMPAHDVIIGGSFVVDGIMGIYSKAPENAVYDLLGRKVDVLKKGNIYLQYNKKVMILQK